MDTPSAGVEGLWLAFGGRILGRLGENRMHTRGGAKPGHGLHRPESVQIEDITAVCGMRPAIAEWLTKRSTVMLTNTTMLYVCLI
jgi:hypothetical protein